MLLGFDCSAYPGSAAMEQLRKQFAFCGFYLGPAPSHRAGDWMAHRAWLANIGYLLMPIYVGQQIVGPGSHNDTAAQGRKDGAQAANLMLAAGFDPRSPVYLDLENGAPFPPAEQAYAFEWVETVKAIGYTPGVYCSHVLAPHFDPDTTRVWAFEVPTTRITFDNLPLSKRNTPPATVPWTGVQYRQNIRLQIPALTVDLDATPDARGLAH